MPFKKHRVLTILKGLFIQFPLLAGFCLQLLFLLSLFINGCVPLSAKWVNAFLANHSFSGLQLSADSYHIRLDGKIEISGLKIYKEDRNKPLLEATSTLLAWTPDFNQSPLIRPTECILTGGVIYLPPIHSPDGRKKTLFTDVALALEINDGQVHAKSICARQEDCTLRGSLKFPILPTYGQSEDPLGYFYSFASKVLSLRSHYDYVTEPTITFEIDTKDSGETDLSLRVLSPLFKDPKIQMTDLQIDLLADLKGGTFTFREPLLISSKNLQIPAYQLEALHSNSQLDASNLDPVLAGHFPKLEFSASLLKCKGESFIDPYLSLEETNEGFLQINGSAGFLQGVTSIMSLIDLSKGGAEIEALGNISTSALLNKLTHHSTLILPEISSKETLHYSLKADLNKHFEVKKARFGIRGQAIVAESLEFDSLTAKGSYSEGITKIEKMKVHRNDQYADANIVVNNQSGAIKAYVRGKMNPKDYNSLLPDWWTSIFEAFTIEGDHSVLADFFVHSGFRKNAKTELFGQVKLKEIDYRNIPISNGQVIVSGTPRHISLQLSEVKSKEGDFKGSIDLTRLPDGKASLIALHLDIESALSSAAMRHLIGMPLYQKLLGDFDFHQAPLIKVQGVYYFTRHYPQYTDKSHFFFSADSMGPFHFHDTPIDSLRLNGFSCDTTTQLRDVRFRYAGGDGRASIDIRQSPNTSDTVSFILDLHHADPQTAINNLPVLDSLEDDFQAVRDTGSEHSGSLDAHLHANGTFGELNSFIGKGQLSVADNQLGTIQLLGPLSKLLQGTALGFTSFELNKMEAQFILNEGLAEFTSVQGDGPSTRIHADGTMALKSQILDMQVSLSLFSNIGIKNNPITHITNLINPLPPLLRFNLTGTLEKQNWRSVYDPRNLLPAKLK